MTWFPCGGAGPGLLNRCFPCKADSRLSSKPVIRSNGTAGSGARRGKRRLRRAMRSADPLPLNSGTLLRLRSRRHPASGGSARTSRPPVGINL